MLFSVSKTVLSMCIYHLQVINASIHPSKHLFPLLWGFWTWVQCRSESRNTLISKQKKNLLVNDTSLTVEMQIHLPLTDFLHSILQLVSLEKYDEDRFVDLITLWKHHQVKLENTNISTTFTIVSFVSSTYRSWVFQRIFNICLSQEHITSANSP